MQLVISQEFKIKKLQLLLVFNVWTIATLAQGIFISLFTLLLVLINAKNVIHNIIYQATKRVFHAIKAAYPAKVNH